MWQMEALKQQSSLHSDTLFPVIFLVCTPTITLTPYSLSSSCMWQIESLKPVHEGMGIFDFLPINVRFCFFFEPSQFSYSLLPMPFHACTASESLYPRVAHVAARHTLEKQGDTQVPFLMSVDKRDKPVLEADHHEQKGFHLCPTYSITPSPSCAKPLPPPPSPYTLLASSTTS